MLPLINILHEIFTQNKLIIRNLPTPMVETNLFRAQVQASFLLLKASGLLEYLYYAHVYVSKTILANAFLKKLQFYQGELSYIKDVAQ